MNEIAGPRAPCEFAVRGYTGQHICDCLLLAMMVNTGASARFDLEHAALHRRFDAELRRNGGLALRAGRLQRALVEFTGVNNTNCRRIAHRFTRGSSLESSRSKRGFANEFSRVNRDSLSYVGRRCVVHWLGEPKRWYEEGRRHMLCYNDDSHRRHSPPRPKQPPHLPP